MKCDDFLISATIIAATVTTAQAQLMLPQAAPTQAQADLANLTMVSAYAVNCKAGVREFDNDGVVDVAIRRSFNRYFPYLQNIGARQAAATRAKAIILEMGLTKFCAAADHDADMQKMVDWLRAGGPPTFY